MWLLTNFGFFSVVRKIGDSDLTIRSRVKADLEILRERYLPSLSPTIGGEGDYPYRAKASHAAVAEAAVEIVRDIQYPNFKNSVAEAQGDDRSRLYHEVWGTLRKLKDEPTKPSAADSSGGSGVTAASASEKESVSTTSVSAGQLINDFAGNEIYANIKYKGKTLRVEGLLEAVTVENGKPHVYLLGKRHMVSGRVVCSFKTTDSADLAQLSKHSRITIQGDCKGRQCYSAEIALINCRLVKAGP